MTVVYIFIQPTRKGGVGPVEIEEVIKTEHPRTE